MKELLLQSIYQYPGKSEKDFQHICEAHKMVSFSKNDFILKEGQMANSYLIVAKGILRSFVYDYEGNDITTNFFIEKELVIEVSSLFQRIPTEEYIQAISDCTCYEIPYENFEELFHNISGFRKWGRGWLSNSLLQFKNRSISIIKESATERYLTLLKEKPEIIQQAPLKHIASYLGITDTSLSRIRKSLS